MATQAGMMSKTKTGAHWWPCNGQLFNPGVAVATVNPHSGRSTGTGYDYVMNVGRHGGGWGGVRGRFGRARVPYDPSGQWYVSIADHSSETNAGATNTVMNPPAGVR